MKNFMESKHAVSSVMGVILMAGLTVVLIGTIAMSVLAYTVPSDAPDAKIVIRQARGDIGTLYKNYIQYFAKKSSKISHLKHPTVILIFNFL
ncbi:MAG: type IV pilin N-terminal domain-containing protein, partial [Candidatus Methanoperedens sp.]|nr:type IV pilin N-terminal domain-containing protein [Candidatus Methanoperedens sp.]